MLSVTSQILALPAEGSFALIGQSRIPRLRWLPYVASF